MILMGISFGKEDAYGSLLYRFLYVDMSSDVPKLRKSIFDCGSEVTLHDLEDVRFNYPDLFV